MRRLARVCELLNTTPKGLLSTSKNNFKSLQDSLQDLVTRLESEKKSPGYIRGLLKSIRSWLRYNDITLTRKIKISNPTATPTIEDEEIPTREELSKILRASSLRTRVTEVLIAFANLRPHSIGNHDESDGLMIKDFPELRIETGRVVFDNVPTMVVVRATLSKTRHKYFTFLSDEGCTYLKEYLEKRLRSGEVLKKKRPIIIYERASATLKFMTTRKISRMIREAMRRAACARTPRPNS
jgi:hypothetical protein